MEIIELRRGDFIYRGAAGRGMGVLGRIVKVKSKSHTIYRSAQASGKVYILNVVYSKHDRFRALKQMND